MKHAGADRRLAAVAAAAAFGLFPLLLAGCASGPQCLPASLHVNPSTVAAGQTVTLSAPAATCDLGYAPGHSYSLSIQTHGTVLKLPDVAVRTDGSFSAVITVPVTAPKGAAEVVVTGSPFDNCDDTGSCAGYGIPLTIQ